MAAVRKLLAAGREAFLSAARYIVARFLYKETGRKINGGEEEVSGRGEEQQCLRLDM